MHSKEQIQRIKRVIADESARCDDEEASATLQALEEMIDDGQSMSDAVRTLSAKVERPILRSLLHRVMNRSDLD